MTARAVTRLAMAVAGIMLAHQTASKAVRDAVFLSGPGVEKLPLMMMLTAAAVVLAVPLWARLLARFGPRTVVPAGFLVSAAAHLVEWNLPADDTRVAAAVYLHVAGFGGLLLSGFWSLVSELFDTNEAKSSYGLIAAAGTLGGLAGGGALLAVPVDSSLAMLAALHVLCAGGVWVLAREARVSTLLDSTGARHASVRSQPVHARAVPGHAGAACRAQLCQCGHRGFPVQAGRRRNGWDRVKTCSPSLHCSTCRLAR